MKTIKPAMGRTYQRESSLSEAVLNIIDEIKARGDAALLEYAARFDRVDLDTVRVGRREIGDAYARVDEQALESIRFAAAQIRFFAEQQLACLKPLSIAGRVPGVEVGHRLIPVERCGCYVPGGRYPLPSTALMSVIPAKVAGVKSIAACSPAHAGAISPAVLVAMDIAGADEIFCMGGAQAVAAYAYGTETVRKVDMIVGPGNRYVTEAKRQVLGEVGIDSLAGPSEVLIIADATANPTFLAIDLLAQAEHDPTARAVLVATDKDLLRATEAELKRLLADLPTAAVAREAWRDNGQLLLAEDLAEAVAYSNSLAPEHVEVQVADERAVAEQLLHYGSLFVGHYAPVALGDFVSGPNHTLPTRSTARFSSGLWVGTFLKVAFHQFVSPEGCRNLAPACASMADLEGLSAHGDSVRLRVNK